MKQLEKRMSYAQAQEIELRKGRHQKALDGIKKGKKEYKEWKTIDNKKPRSLAMAHRRNRRAKREQEEIMKARKIQQDNERLLQRMAAILKSKNKTMVRPPRSRPVSAQTKSRQTIQSKIRRENALFEERLQQIKSVFSNQEWQDSFEANQRHVRNLSIFKRVTEEGATKSSSSARPPKRTKQKSAQSRGHGTPSIRTQRIKKKFQKTQRKQTKKVKKIMPPEVVQEEAHKKEAKEILQNHIVVKRALKIGKSELLVRIAWVGLRREIEIKLSSNPCCSETIFCLLSPQVRTIIECYTRLISHKGSIRDVLNFCIDSMYRHPDGNGIVVAADKSSALVPLTIERIDKVEILPQDLSCQQNHAPENVETLKENLLNFTCPQGLTFIRSQVTWMNENRTIAVWATDEDQKQFRYSFQAGLTRAHNSTAQRFEAIDLAMVLFQQLVLLK